MNQNRNAVTDRIEYFTPDFVASLRRGCRATRSVDATDQGDRAILLRRISRTARIMQEHAIAESLGFDGKDEMFATFRKNREHAQEKQSFRA